MTLISFPLREDPSSLGVLLLPRRARNRSLVTNHPSLLIIAAPFRPMDGRRGNGKKLEEWMKERSP